MLKTDQTDPYHTLYIASSAFQPLNKPSLAENADIAGCFVRISNFHDKIAKSPQELDLVSLLPLP